jgi:tetratricopeptide (TPR) repeat protein
MATPNCRVSGLAPGAFETSYFHPKKPWGRRFAVFLVISPLLSLHAKDIAPSDCAKRVRVEYWRANTAHTNAFRDVTKSWHLARACFDVGENATNSSERAEIAEKGITICRDLIARDPNLAPAHHYLGMNLGQLARTRGLGALKLVSEMETEFKRAAALDPKFDNAGPDRNLGLLYREAPHVASIGSRAKSRQHLQKAADLAPDFPENRLNLIESFLRWSDRNGARRELKALEELWPRALTNLTGETWECSWTDWKKRFQQVKKKVEEAPKAIESPRNKD